MLNFASITTDDADPLRSRLRSAPDRGCEYTFGNLLIWAGIYGTKYCLSDGFAVFRFEHETAGYLFPVGEGDLTAVIEKMRADGEERFGEFWLIALRRQDCDELERLFPGKFEFELERNYSEYVYNSADLINLAGKKYHGKRGHVARFLNNNPGYRFVKIDRDNIDRVRDMDDEWCRLYGCDEDGSLRSEHCAVEVAFDHYFELGFDGGFVETAEGRIVAFAMGEPIDQDTYCVHIEKAFHDVEGAYAVINRDFATAFCGEYLMINREDDVGEEGLRKAKLSYYPVTVTDKYFAKYRP